MDSNQGNQLFPWGVQEQGLGQAFPEPLIKEEPMEENQFINGHTPTNSLGDTPFSDALKLLRNQAGPSEFDGQANGESLILPYPNYNSAPATDDVYDMISKTAQSIVSSLQNATAHLEMDSSMENESLNAMGIEPPLIQNPQVNNGTFSTEENQTSSSEPRTVQYTEPHTLYPAGHVAQENAGPTKPNSNPFHIDQSLLTSVPVHQQSEELQSLGLKVYNQDDFERGIMDQVDQAMAKEEGERLIKIVQKDVKAVKEDMRIVKEEMLAIAKAERALTQATFRSKEAAQKLTSIERQKENKIKQLKKLKARLKLLNKKLNPNQEPGSNEGDAQDEEEVAIEEALGLGPKKTETEAERMIRQGEMTPFGTVMFKNKTGTQSKPSASLSGPRLTKTDEMTDFEKYLADQQQKKVVKKKIAKPTNSRSKAGEHKQEEGTNEPSVTPIKKSKSAPSLSHMDEDKTDGSPRFKKSKSEKKKRENMFDARDKRVYKPAERDFSNYRSSRPRLARLKHNFSGDGRLSDHEDYDDDSHLGNAGDREYIPPPDMLLGDDDDYLSGEKEPRDVKPRRAKKKMRKRAVEAEMNLSDGEGEGSPRKRSRKQEADYNEGLPTGRQRDDGDYGCYQRRVKAWKRGRLIKKQEKAEKGEQDSDDSEFEDIEVDDGFKVPAQVWNKLYKYQKTCVKWLWELHMQQAGGIIGDEMGLGKTIQLISFLVGLRVSRARDRGANTKYLGLGPTLIACPATVMHQWVKEFHKWWPPFRVAVLHGSGSSSSSPAQLIDDIVAGHGVLITSFSSLTINQDILLDYDWHYVVLDEGHKIRNPDAQVTIAAKRFRTCHRIILSGSPIQNNLKELWSLFDFIFPGKLGTLPDFMAHFAVPIQQGGYSTASQVQVQTAYKCACVLRDTINPYLLRRMKSDVRHNLSLPDKNEQVLFCRLTGHQRDIYKEYIDSRECMQIIKGEFMVFPGLITLRKICNHPDLTTGGPQEFDTGRDYEDGEREFGHYKRSGKMIVVESLLKLWRRQGHRVLLFTQSRQMLDLLESFVNTEGYTYIRMDGGTSISARQPLISKFNDNPSYFAFLLTTRVGGLGVNLTGANRVVIFDPDWNPSTDTQARERAWRIGQMKDVTVYRLITAGTIEEKIYHRQIFKQFLTNRVLKDPKQRRLFKANDMYELFTLNDVGPRGTTETSAIFAGTGSDVKINKDKLKKGSDYCNPVFKPVKKPNRFDIMRAAKEKAKAENKLTEEMESDEDFGLESEAPVKPKKSSRKKETKSKQRMNSKSSLVDEELSGELTNEKMAVKEENGPDTQDTQECSETIDLTREDADDKEPSDSNAEVSNEDSRTKRLKELARRLSQKFSLKGEVSLGEKKPPEKKIQVKKEKDTVEKKRGEAGKPNEDGTGSSDGKEMTRKSPKKERKSKEDKRDRKHHKKGKKKRRKDVVFEGERIDHLAKFEAYENAGADPEKEKAKKADQDEYVLARLFKKTGVHSAMQHDKIMMSSEPDFALVEGEAERVARDAVRALRQSRSQCHSARSGIPTWTGQSGGQPAKPRFGLKKNTKLAPSSTLSKPNGAVKPESENTKKPDKASTSEEKHFDGTTAGNVKTASGKSASLMSSGELLSRMKARKQLATDEGSTDQGAFMAPVTPLASENMELITDIRNYVAFMAHVDGQASTKELVDYFKSKIGSGDSAKFKAMLKQVCEFNKRDGVGLWFLKPEFR